MRDIEKGTNSAAMETLIAEGTIVNRSKRSNETACPMRMSIKACHLWWGCKNGGTKRYMNLMMA